MRMQRDQFQPQAEAEVSPSGCCGLAHSVVPPEASLRSRSPPVSSSSSWPLRPMLSPFSSSPSSKLLRFPLRREISSFGKRQHPDLFLQRRIVLPPMKLKRCSPKVACAEHARPRTKSSTTSREAPTTKSSVPAGNERTNWVARFNRSVAEKDFTSENMKNLGFPFMEQYGFSRAHRVLRFFGWRDALKVAQFCFGICLRRVVRGKKAPGADPLLLFRIPLDFMLAHAFWSSACSIIHQLKLLPHRLII